MPQKVKASQSKPRLTSKRQTCALLFRRSKVCLIMAPASNRCCQDYTCWNQKPVMTLHPSSGRDHTIENSGVAGHRGDACRLASRSLAQGNVDRFWLAVMMGTSTFQRKPVDANGRCSFKTLPWHLQHIAKIHLSNPTKPMSEARQLQLPPQLLPTARRETSTGWYLCLSKSAAAAQLL